jgi:tetratricopeptide (TPR) repeat protein
MNIFGRWFVVLAVVPSICAADVKFERSSGLDGIALIGSTTFDPIQYDALKHQVQTLAGADRFVEAEPLAERLVKLYPYDGRNWFVYGRVKRKLGKFADAAAAYQKTIELLGPGVPNSAEYWKAVSLLRDGRHEEALDTLGKLLDEDHYLHKPNLYDDELLGDLKENSRFKKLTGKIDASKWSRNDGWRNDVDYLVSEVVRVNPDFHDRPLPELFRQRYKNLRERIPQMSDEQVYVGMSRMLASLNQGHTNLWPFRPARRMAFKTLPISLYIFPEGIFVVGADVAHQRLVGAQLLKIGDTPAMSALNMIRDIHPADSGMEILWWGPDLLTFAQELVGLGIAKDANKISIQIRTREGVVETVDLDTVPLAEYVRARTQSAQPLALEHKDNAHWFTPIAEIGALYVQVNQTLDSQDETLEAFGLRLKDALTHDTPRTLILDFRNNNGGNTFLYVELLRTIIAFTTDPSHRLYVIIGRNTYSAAANLVADLERLAHPVFVGEPTSMTGNAYGDESEVVLPYSGIAAGVTGVKWQLGYPYDLRRAIVPDIPVELTAHDYFEGRDPILETIKTLTRR